MSNLSRQAEQAREGARQSDGKFGSWNAGESGIELPPPAFSHDMVTAPDCTEYPVGEAVDSAEIGENHGLFFEPTSEGAWRVYADDFDEGPLEDHDETFDDFGEAKMRFDELAGVAEDCADVDEFLDAKTAHDAGGFSPSASEEKGHQWADGVEYQPGDIAAEQEFPDNSSVVVEVTEDGFDVYHAHRNGDTVGDVSSFGPDESHAAQLTFHELEEQTTEHYENEYDGAEEDSDKWGEFREADRRDIQPGTDTGYDEPSDHAASVVAEQGITGYSRIGEPIAQEHHFGTTHFTPHRVTLTNSEGDELTLPHQRGSAYGDEPPTASQALGAVIDDSRLAEIYDNVDDFSREMGFDPVDHIDDPEKWEQMKRDYQNIQDDAESLRNFIGDESYEKLMWGED